MLTFFFQHCKRAVLGIKGSLLVNTVTVVTITIALVLFGGYLLLITNMNAWLATSERSFDIKLYLADSVNSQDEKAIVSAVKKDASVESFKLVSQKEAKAVFLNRYPDFEDVLTDLNYNPFPKVISVQLKKVEKAALKAFSNKMGKLKGVEEIDYGQRWLERFVGFRNSLRLGGYILASLILVACVFLVSNTIRLNIFNREDEIEIYKLVGGTRAFIAGPFIIEGVILGTCGAIFAIILTFIFFKMATGSVDSHLSTLAPGLKGVFLDSTRMLQMVFVGALSGVFGSIFSLRRFLRY